MQCSAAVHALLQGCWSAYATCTGASCGNAISPLDHNRRPPNLWQLTLHQLRPALILLICAIDEECWVRHTVQQRTYVCYNCCVWYRDAVSWNSCKCILSWVHHIKASLTQRLKLTLSQTAISCSIHDPHSSQSHSIELQLYSFNLISSWLFVGSHSIMTLLKIVSAPCLHVLSLKAITYCQTTLKGCLTSTGCS